MVDEDRIIPKDDMTAEEREAAEAHIRSVERQCRGPLPESAREDIAEALEKGQESLARHIDRTSRPGCGEDFTPVVIEGPWDGERHEYTCPDPDCGNEGFYTAPFFDRELLDRLTSEG